jgi:hypothetical protein
MGLHAVRCVRRVTLFVVLLAAVWAKPMHAQIPEHDTAWTPWKWSVQISPAFDWVWTHGPDTTITTVVKDTICTQRIAAGSGLAHHFGFSGGVMYGPFGLRGRYTDLSGNFDTVGFDFKTVGLELSYHPLKSWRWWSEQPWSEYIDASFEANFDGRINTYRQGLGSARVERDANWFIPRLGAGIHAQYVLPGVGIAVGPEFQFKWSPVALAPQDGWFSGSFGAVTSLPLGFLKRLFGGGPAEATPNVASLTFQTEGQECDVYLIESRYYSRADSTAFEQSRLQCFRSGLAGRWQKNNAQALFGPYYAFAVTRKTDHNRKMYTTPQPYTASSPNETWTFADFLPVKCP